jgi:rhodanese-related sulfurtransferase
MNTPTAPFRRAATICFFAAVFSASIGFAVRENLVATRQAPPPVRAPEQGPLSLSEFRALVDQGQALIIDARDDLFFARGHVPNAVSLPRARFAARYAQLRSRLEADRARAMVVYCSNQYCGDSAEVQSQLKELGYTQVTVFADGWDAWRAAGYPLQKSDSSTVELPPWKNPS